MARGGDTSFGSALVHPFSPQKVEPEARMENRPPRSHPGALPPSAGTSSGSDSSASPASGMASSDSTENDAAFPEVNTPVPPEREEDVVRSLSSTRVVEGIDQLASSDPTHMQEETALQTSKKKVTVLGD